MVTRQKAQRAKRSPPAEALVSKEAVQDLLRSVGSFLHPGMKVILEAVKANLRLVEIAGTPEGEKACVDKMAERFLAWRSLDVARVAIRDCVRELCNYRYEIREQILTAAIVRVTDLMEKTKQLEKMLPRVKTALLSLDDRTMALCKVRVAFIRVEGKTDIHFREEVIDPSLAKGQQKIGMLRRDAKLRDLMRAYDLATEIDEAY